MRPITTLQDGTEILSTTGDLDAFAYGGGVFYRYRREVAWQFWDAREPGEKNFVIYKALVPENVLDCYDVSLGEGCEIADIEKSQGRRLSRSNDPKDRLDVVQMIRDARGPSFFGHEPEELSPWELADRWGMVFGTDIKRVNRADIEDFIVRECRQGYECGQADGLYLGRFKTYEEALIAVANEMKRQSSTANLFHEHAPGKLELILWQPSQHVGPLRHRRAKLPVAFWRNAMKRYAPKAVPRRGPSVKTMRQRTSAATRQEERRRHAQAIREKMESLA